MQINYLEIGVAQAEYALKLLKGSGELFYTGVDRWLCDPTMEHEPNKIKNWNTQEKWDEIYFNVVNKLKPFGNRARIIRGNSRDILPNLNEKFDVIRVDGDHSEEGAYQDIINASLLLNIGGQIVVDDMNYDSVRKAVARFLKENDSFHIKKDTITKK